MNIRFTERNKTMTWKTGDADQFLEDIMKPKRLSQIEDYYQDSSRIVKFDNEFDGEWMVDIRGTFSTVEFDEINRALKAANKAGKL